MIETKMFEFDGPNLLPATYYAEPSLEEMIRFYYDKHIKGESKYIKFLTQQYISQWLKMHYFEIENDLIVK